MLCLQFCNHSIFFSTFPRLHQWSILGSCLWLPRRLPPGLYFAQWLRVSYWMSRWLGLLTSHLQHHVCSQACIAAPAPGPGLQVKLSRHLACVLSRPWEAGGSCGRQLQGASPRGASCSILLASTSLCVMTSRTRVVSGWSDVSVFVFHQDVHSPAHCAKVRIGCIEIHR